MTGGLYRSANAAPDDDPPAGEPPVPVPVEAQPALDAGGPPQPGAGADGSSGAAASSAVMAVGSLISRGTGFVRTAAIAATLGGGIVANAYTTAQLFPGMIYELLLGGILSSVVVPVLVRRRRSDPDRGEAYAQRLLTLATLALAGATALAVLAAPLLTRLYASGETSPEFRGLVTTFSYLMLPIMFFSGVSALLGAVLNTRGHFAAPMWAPILNNLVVIGAAGLYVALFGARAVGVDAMTPGRIAVIGGGTLLGVVVQTAGLWPALRRVGFRWRWRFDVRALGLRELARLGGWMFCYVAVSQVGVFVLLNLLNQASKDGRAAGVAIYNNVFLLMMMAHGIVAVSIITALMPRMSAAAADGRFADVAADLSRGTRMSTAVLAPLAVCYAVLAQPISITLFERGAFGRGDSRQTSIVLLVAAVALVPFAVSQLFTFAFYAMPDTKTPALINIPVVALRVAVQVALFAAFSASFTAAGLMLGNAVSYVAAVLLSGWYLRSRVGRIGLRRIAVTTGKVLVAAAGAALAGLGVLALLPGGADPTWWQAFLRLVIGGLAIGLAYLLLALTLRLGEMSELLGLVRRRLGR
ncbi:MAG TPA: murein biosynthesis integral membrane protein MurJ [Pilimelia sp.]|nr:murein biosynthesis integral membrane protein MurJ [Pilimelia sp.]